MELRYGYSQTTESVESDRQEVQRLQQAQLEHGVYEFNVKEEEYEYGR